MNKVEYDDSYRYRLNQNFIENDRYSLYIKLKIGLFQHHYKRSDFKADFLNNKVSTLEFEEFIYEIETSVNHFSIMTILLMVIYFTIFTFIFILPIGCLIWASAVDKNTDVTPIFIILITSVLFGFFLLLFLRFLYVRVLERYEKTIQIIIAEKNKKKFISRNVLWSLGKNCLYLRANIIDANSRIDQDFYNNYLPPNEYVVLSSEEKIEPKKPFSF